MGIKPTPIIYTSVFNVCFYAGDKSQGLEMANSVLGLMRSQSYEMNAVNYKVNPDSV